MQKVHPRGHVRNDGSRVLWKQVIHTPDRDLKSPEGFLEEVTPELLSLERIERNVCKGPGLTPVSTLRGLSDWRVELRGGCGRRQDTSQSAGRHVS